MKDLRQAVIAEVRAAHEAGKITDRQLEEAESVRFPSVNARILGTSSKVEKSKNRGYLTAIVYLAPASESVRYGGQNTCPFASPGCALACLGTKARLRMSCGTNAKAWKTLLWLYCPELFTEMLYREVYNLRNRAVHMGLIPAVRLNGSSDVAWERKLPELFARFSDVVFYDYSKSSRRVLSKSLPSNYHLTFSRSETNEREAIGVLHYGRNVAVVFTDLQSALDGTWNGFRVVNGDETDARPTDDTGVVVGLSPKGKAKDSTGFFVHN